MNVTVASPAASSTYSPRAHDEGWAAFTSPLLLAGMLSAGVVADEAAITGLSRIFGQPVYESRAIDATERVLGTDVFAQALGLEASVVAEDFARYALDIVQRQRTIEPDTARQIAARWHELFE